MNGTNDQDAARLRADDARVEALRRLIPATTAVTYLNTGTSGPLPRPVYDRLRANLDGEYADGRIGMQSFASFFENHAAAKAALGRLLNVAPQQVSLTPSTSAGMAMAAADIDWQPGDEVITIDIEYPAIKRIFYSLERRRGIVGKAARVGEASGDITARIDEQITGKTKLVALSHLSYTNGAVYDIAPIARLCRDRGILTLIDGAQSVGAMPVDLAALDVDYYAFAGQKWLCGPSATGGLYVHPSRREEPSPYTPANSPYPALETDYYFETDRRFEVFFKVDPGSIGGLAAAVDFLLDEVGFDWASERAHRLAHYAAARLAAVPSLTVRPPEHFGTMFAVGIDGKNPHDVVVALMDKNIQTRSIPYTPHIRISTHYYNTIEDIERAAEALAMLAASG